MKKYGAIVTILFLMSNGASGELRNGYEKHIRYVREALRNYYDLIIVGNLSAHEKRKMKTRMEELITFQSYYELTESLLAQFKIISPSLYNKIDSIKDANERPVDVYVKFVPRDEGLVMAAGTTYMAQLDEDEDGCRSEYGKQTVSIRIWNVSKALFVLAHEFGHVNYQVPNLATYTEYYKKVYPQFMSESNCIGHESSDPSGRNASTFEKEFKKDYLDYLELVGGRQLESPLVLIQDIRRKVQSEIHAQVFAGKATNDRHHGRFER